MKLSKALNTATDALYASLSAKPIIITPSHTEALHDRVREEMIKTGYDKPFHVEITLDDENEFIDVHVLSGDDAESVGLKYEGRDGNFVVRVDTDGDGK